MTESVPFHAVVVFATVCIVAWGAHWVVESSCRIALRLGISQLVVGLTVVSIGTSAPELVVTVMSALRGQGDISVGNVVGSNIFNLGFILGACALLHPIDASRSLVARDGMVLVGSSLLSILLLGVDLRMDRGDGILLLVLMGLYMAKLYKDRSGDPSEEGEDLPDVAGGPPIKTDLVYFTVGLTAILVGAHFMVQSASAIARAYGISDWVIGVTIVAAGTSAPEFATSLVAGLRGRYDISAGNLVGSNIFNLMAVLAVSGIIQPVPIAPAARTSILVMTGISLLTVGFLRSGWRVSRLEGAILLVVALAAWGWDLSNQGG